MDNILSSLAPAMTPPESSRNSDTPGISRKITACIACRKQKIKCHMNGSSPPCARCKKRGLSCIVNRSLHMLLENDVSWKDTMEQRMQRMETMMENVVPRSSLAQNPSQDQALAQFDENIEGQHKDHGSSIEADDQPQQSWEVVMDPDHGPGAIPASCVTESPTFSSIDRRGATFSRDSDIVSQGIISLATAEKYFHLYRQHLDPVVYNILAAHDSLANIRAESALLIAVVCAVSALASGSPDYQVCYQAFRNLFAAQLLSKKHSFDDVRALCIGAFFLSDMSWNLIGAAVRIASEINLHRCVTKIPHVKMQCYNRTRLYFLVYVCDHHFSIAYGRPPMAREFDSLSSPMAFLDSEYATDEDARLVSQVELWSINGRIFDTFGVDPEMTFSESLLPQLRRLSIALDTWRSNWSERFGHNGFMGSHSKIDIALHFHFAKLYLSSHVFRGPQLDSEYQLSNEMQEFGNSAVYSAFSIIRVIVDDHEIQSLLSNLPAYFDTMIAFAAVFLLKMARKDTRNVKIDREEVFGLIKQLIPVLTTITTEMHAQHLLYSIATSIESLLHKTREAQLTMTEGAAEHVNVQDTLIPSSDLFMNNYDFFWPQDVDLEYDCFGT